MLKGKDLIMNINYIKHVKYKNVLPKASTSIPLSLISSYVKNGNILVI